MSLSGRLGSEPKRILASTFTVFEAVTDGIFKSGTNAEIAKIFDCSQDQVELVVDVAVASLLDGLTEMAAPLGGLYSIESLLSKTDASVIGDYYGYLRSGQVGRGEKVLRQIFPADHGVGASQMALKVKVSPEAVRKAMVVVGPLLLGEIVVAKNKKNLEIIDVVHLIGMSRDESRAFARSKRRSGRSQSRSKPRPPTRPPTRRVVDQQSLSLMAGSTCIVFLLAWVLSLPTSGTMTLQDVSDFAGISGGESTREASQLSEQDQPIQSTERMELAHTADDQELAETALEALLGDYPGVVGEVSDGVVTLRGSLDDEATVAKLLAELAASPGVVRVNNQIIVGEVDTGKLNGQTGELGDAVTLNDLLQLAPIEFNVDSAELTHDSKEILGLALQYLVANPSVVIEVGGHTDSDGSTAANKLLSQRRAESVVEFLNLHGITADRMTTVGYGESSPKVPNDSKSNKALNRRIVFRILNQ